jgi:hypothetical protein
MFMLEEGKDVWRVRQIIADPESNHDWSIGAEVDLAASDETGEAVIKVNYVQEMGSDS